ncbi:MAG: putative transposase [Glaciecola sp.]|jgi:putative transposase
MPIARSKQIILTETSYYHCISRCVRRAFLCGKDKLTGKNYEYRRAWFENRLNELSAAFAINVCAYAIMHNHNHLVLYVDSKLANSWSDLEVIQRWHSVHSNKLLSQIFQNTTKHHVLNNEQKSTVKRLARIYRDRLSSISFFMKALNQNIAIRANKEDKCTGKFWESRFKSQALLDERAVLSCMIYVDLNPIRAGIATSLQNSNYTSIKKRLACIKTGHQPSNLMPLKVAFSPSSECINIELKSYLKLIRQTADQLQKQEQSTHLKKVVKLVLLDKIGIDEKAWLTLSMKFEDTFSYVVGPVANMDEYRKKLNQKKLKGMSVAARIFQ